MKNTLAAVLFAFLAILFLPHNSRADDLNWTATNPQSTQMTGDSIHFSSFDPKLGSHYATAKIDLPAGQPWEFDFSVTMTPASGVGMSVALMHGADRICWTGAGDYYKYISGFLSSDASNMPYDEPWNTSLHSFRYVYDGQNLSLWHNGQKLGETRLTTTPDVLRLESSGMDLTVSSISFRSGSALSVNAVGDTGGLTIPTSPITHDPFDANFIDSGQFASQWKQTLNGGSVTLSGGTLKVTACPTGFPTLKTVSDPFPTTGDWTASIGFHYFTIGNYGTEIKFRDVNDHDVFVIHQDVNGLFANLGATEVWRSKPGTSWHVISVVSVGKQLSVSIDDGRPVAGFTPIDKPTSICIGGYSMTSPWDSNNLEFQFIRVAANGTPLTTRDLSKYVVTEIGILPGDVESVATAINNNGVVTGVSITVPGVWSNGIVSKDMLACKGHAIVFDNGRLTDIGLQSGFSQSTAECINDNGWVGGCSDDFAIGGSRSIGWIWKNGILSNIQTSNGIQVNQVVGINNSNIYLEECGAQTVVVDNSGIASPLDDVAGCDEMFPDAITDTGKILVNGARRVPDAGLSGMPYVKENGYFSPVGSIPGCRSAEGGALNNDGVAVGSCALLNGTTVPFVDQRAQTVLLPLMPGYVNGTAEGINDAGVIVGFECTSADTEPHACRWNGGIPEDLTTLLPKDSGWQLTEAEAINGKGQIAATGIIGGARHACLLTPTY